MAEFNASFQPEVNLNGHEPEPVAIIEGEALSLPRVDVRRGVFIASNGNELELSGKQVNALVLQMIQNQGKPGVPKIETTIGGKYKQVEDNPNDPNYQQALAEWRNESGIRVGRYLFSVGVKGQPPEAFVLEHAEFFPDASASDLKYLWVASQVPNEDIGALCEAIMSQTIPTEKGLSAAANFTASG